MTQMRTLRDGEKRSLTEIFPLQDSVEMTLALQPEDPVFCFSAITLAKRIAEFRSGFAGEVSYAVKSNPSAKLLRTAGAHGIEVFDVASPQEMQAVREMCPKASFHYHNPVKSRHEIAVAHGDFGCTRFAADSIEEINKIADVIGDACGIEIAVRFRMTSHGAAVHDFSSKFGVDPDCAAMLLQQVVALGFDPVLTFHPGSQCCDPQAWASHIEQAAGIARQAGIALKALNVGGGFPARYMGGSAPRLQSYFDTIASTADRAFHGAPPRLECEPGRAISAPAFSLVTRVKLVRGSTGDVFLNDGLYGGLLEVCQAPELQPYYRVIRNGQVVKPGPTQDYSVFGPTCDPLDVLPNKLSLPVDLAEGDYVEFAGIGAYGSATATRFNGYGTAETLDVLAPFVG